MNTQQLIAKLKQYPLAVGCTLVLVVMLVLGFLRSDRLPELNTQYDALQQEAEKINSNSQNAVDLAANLEKLNALVSNIESRLIDTDANTDNYRYFLGMAERAGVNLVDPSTGTRKGDPNMKVYPIVEFNLSISGSFENVLKFLYELRTGRHIMRVESLSIIPKDSPSMKYNVQASIIVNGIAEKVEEPKKK
ncbi:hypothetical protein [Cerasicoccus arenae]|uniref:Pilus assembly protein PilO n=1 Tax=Cerasicoccus arenae TaxID=424488 RepID=A0A8J3DDQ9_9BACT|nr:hypothetical protein [Cerasicoccus arenae]MBK1859307.1 hypothetical protein [Cerasicoccus arenae]GHB94260.1 hypothetical protein GCM10007047_07420 [Cerasicoccus arenae]